MTEGESRILSKAEIRELIRDTIADAVPEALDRLGFDVGEPQAMRRDLAFLRDLRGATDVARRHGLFTIVGLLLAAAAGLLWIGLQSKVRGIVP
jgi:hypothetical protein